MKDREIWNELRGDIRHCYIPPIPSDGIPLYWMHEQTGFLRAAILALLSPDDPPLEPDQVRLIREYIVHWINAPLWRYFAEKSRAAFVVQTNRANNREDLLAVLHELLDAGIDPL